MTIAEFFVIGFRDVRFALQRHKLLALAFIVLCVAGISPRFLRGDILGPGDIEEGDGSALFGESLRSCNSIGTIFKDTENLGEARMIYREAMANIVGEREKILSTSSEWKCGTGSEGEPSMPKLLELADKLPGWHYHVTVPFLFGSTSLPVLRPVTFASFSAIVAEVQREYECKLTEIQDRNIAEVSLNNDIEKPAKFCCITVGDSGGCRQQTDQAMCDTTLTSDPGCDGACPILLYMSDLAERVPNLHSSLTEERQISRVAVERTLSTLRSFEMNYAIARQLMCYERASLDLKNEMSLLADAVSCMPKIWDAVTSIHDRKP